MSSPAAKRLSDLEVEVARLRNEVATLSRRIGHVDLATVVDRLAVRVAALDQSDEHQAISLEGDGTRSLLPFVSDRAQSSEEVAERYEREKVDPVLANEIVSERVIETDRPPASE